ncbi:MAG: putative O-glycosylation ligase, exosortase A system-associated [Alphaproteobacteria bacterium]
MRSHLLLVTLMGLIPVSWIHPFAGVLVWSWLSFMSPHQLTWGLATDLRLNLIVSLATLLGFMFSREPKSIPSNTSIVLLFLFAILWVLSTIPAMAPYLAQDLLVRNLKTFVLLYMIMALVHNRLRLHAFMLVIVISVGYFAVYGGLVGILSGGNSRFTGPPGTHIGDNNHLALAIVIVIPLMNYIRMYSENKFVRLALLASMGLGVITVLVTYSRGGFLGLAAMGAVFWWKSKHKLASAVIIAVLAVPAFHLMPQKWWDRMDTIETAAEHDSSFQSRLASWETSFNLAVANPILGGGFSATQDPSVYAKYKPADDPSVLRAAHSIYFQVLGDMGFVGLAVFLMIFFSGWLNSVAVIRGGNKIPGMEWAVDLSKMIQVSMAGYLVAGAALSMAYYDVTLALIVVLARLRTIVANEQNRVTTPETLPMMSGQYVFSKRNI